MTDVTQNAIPAAPPAPPGPFKSFWISFSSNRGALGGLIVIALLALVAILAPVLAPHDPITQYREAIINPYPPFWIEGGTTEFILGTDDRGRDILSRIMYGAQISLMIGLFAVSLALLVGVLLGLSSAFFGGTVDVLVMRFVDIMLALPSLLLAIVIVTILGPSLINTMIAVSIVSIPHITRLTRATAQVELSKDYVVASRVSGAKLPRLMFLTVLPNCAAPLIVYAALGFSEAILSAAGLGFLGLGAQPPDPEWGAMLATARGDIANKWWLATFPGLAILITVLAFNLMGDGLRDALDPKLKR